MQFGNKYNINQKNKKVECPKVPCRWSCEQQRECEWRSRLLEREQRFFELEHEQRLSAHIKRKKMPPLGLYNRNALHAHELSNATSEGHEPRQPSPIRQKAGTSLMRLKAMDSHEIPYMCDVAPCKDVEVAFPIPNLIDEIASDKNIEDSFDYVIGHLECKEQREKMRPKKKGYCARLKKELSDGKFCITDKDFYSMQVTDGPKRRIVQVPKVYHRVGCHAVMVPFEKYTYPTMIRNTAASVKGRGMHWLHQILEEDLLADPMLIYFYQCDIEHFYDNISQEIMISQVRGYTSDEKVLPMMINFITLLDDGLSKGLRSSQCLANLHLSPIDHNMCEKVSYHEIDDASVEGGKGVAVSGDGRVVINGKEIRYHYYRYCDDIVLLGYDKKELWLLRDYLNSLLAELGLSIKRNEAVRPICVGLNYLGYVTFVDDSKPERVVFSLIRKRTKQKFARRLKKVKSRKRRQVLIGSFFGMAAHCDCRHLLRKLLTPKEFYKLKHRRKMKEFGNFNVSPPMLDGKKSFKGQKVSSMELDRKGIIVVDFERDVVPRREREDYNRRLQAASAQGVDPELVEKPKTKYILSLIVDGNLRKLWTGDKEIWQILEDIDKQDGFPFFVGVTIDYSGQYKKLNFVPASHLGLHVPTDEELDRLLTLHNLKTQ